MIDLTQSNDEAETERTMSPKRVKATSKATSTGELVLLSNNREVIDLDAVEGHGVVDISDDDEDVRNVKTEQVELAGVLGTLIKYKEYYAPKKNNVRSTWTPGQTVPAGPPSSTFHTNRPRITQNTPQPRLFERANPKYRWEKGRLYIWVGQLKDIQVFNGVEQVTILPNRVEVAFSPDGQQIANYKTAPLPFAFDC
jgi:hypothetical protein